MSKVRKTLTRILANDRTVYRDLKSYGLTKVSVVRHKINHKVKGQASNLSTSINLSMQRKSEYGVDLLFDKDFYQEQTERTFENYEDAYEHFKSEGQSLGLNPHPLFNTQFYLSHKPVLGELTVIEHYFETAGNTRFSPSVYFDTKYYLEMYPWTNKYNPLAHFLTYGYIDKHNPSLFFDVGFYFQTYIQKMSGVLNPVLHYLEKGWRAGLNPHPMIDSTYIASQLNPGVALEDLGVEPLHAFISAKPSRDYNKILNPNRYFDSLYFHLGSEKNIDGKAISGYEALKAYLDTSLYAAGKIKDIDPEYTLLRDPSFRFSERRYKEANPDIGDYNGLYHYLRHGQHEGRVSYTSCNSAQNSQLKASLILDPEIINASQDIVKATFVATPRTVDPLIQAMTDMVLRRGDFRPDIIYLMPGFFKGGAEKYGAKLVNRLSSVPDGQKVLVITTDNEIEDTIGWINSSNCLKILRFEEKQLGLSLNSKADLLSRFIMWCNPSVVINNNSNAGWHLYRRYGKSLSSIMRLTATLFCYEYDKFGNKVGYARDNIRITAEYLDAVFVDNSSFGDVLTQDFSLGLSAKNLFRVLHQPFEEKTTELSEIAIVNEVQSVLWAARFVPQKNVALLREIAIEMPQVEFCLWAIGGWNSKIAGGSIPKNVKIIEDNTSFNEIAKRGFDAFLLTSDWEGLPTTLIEASWAGLPIIASHVGGVADVVTNETGWLVPKGDKEAFINALNECLNSPELTARKVNLSQEHLVKQHSDAVYSKSLKAYGLLPCRAKPLRMAPKRSAKEPQSQDVSQLTVKKKPVAKTVLDATLIVNGHREQHYILPTLKSIQRVYDYTVRQGYSCEYIIVLDNPDEITEKICRNFAKNNDARILKINVRDLGLARNQGVIHARGEYVAFMDGDDMATENWVVQGLKTGRASGPNIVLHPAMNYVFGNENTYVYLHRDMDDPDFSMAALICENYWTALSMARRDIYLKYPYSENALNIGLAYEDWSWNSMTIAGGVKHKIINDTAHFIRRKSTGSLLQQTVASASLPRLYYLSDMSISK